MQSFRMTMKSLQANKMRSFLTMLGIIIGVASVIVLTSLMNGLSKDITSSLQSAGTNTITVNIPARGSTRTFGVSDMEKFVAETPDLFKSFSPSVGVQITAKNGTDSVDTSATGVNENYDEIQKTELSAGRFIQYVDVARLQKVCVIGSYIADKLFGGNVYADSALIINGSSYTVIGVLKEISDSTASSTDDIVYIPYTTATRLAGNAFIGTWTLEAASVDKIEKAMTAINSKLYTVFNDEDAYRVFSMSQMIKMMEEVTGSISLVLVGIAGISLLVGGIGIMNIMLVSVTERTREIGIRKALGAKRRDIMSQFIIEAAVTSATGGVTGIIVGIALSLLASSAMKMTTVQSPNSVLLAFGVSVAIGMVFGYFPAGKAAKLNPIDALRYE
jgi:putative ABC transport system permease protein